MIGLVKRADIGICGDARLAADALLERLEAQNEPVRARETASRRGEEILGCAKDEIHARGHG